MHLIIPCLLLISSVSYSYTTRQNDRSPEFWFDQGSQNLENAIKRTKPNLRNAKNVIIFVGDGMGISTITAARIYLGQKHGQPGENYQLAFEKFPFVSLSKTYNVDRQVPDSAGTATAIFTGVKTNFKTLGVSAFAAYNVCKTLEHNKISSILQWSQEAGKDTGIVTTTRITHATPAALYAHVPNRDWESDANMANNSDNAPCKDIALQLIEDSPGQNIKVILGGGRKTFLPKTTGNSHSGVRLDNRNLIHEWKKNEANLKQRSKYVTNAKELEHVMKKPVDHLLGLFSEDHMEYELHRNKSHQDQPSISTMTKAAITVLQRNPKGFFLMVEGGRIDHGHHENRAKLALEDAVAFNEAVQVAKQMTSEDDTLIIVTADHSHTFVINGYPYRGNPILGKVNELASDNLPYTTLMYTTGHVQQTSKRRNLTSVDTGADDFIQDSIVPFKDETHGGEDVAIFAVGPQAHLLHGVIEQNYIAHVMAYASCVGQYSGHCTTFRENIEITSSSSITKFSRFVFVLTTVLLLTFLMH